MSESDEILGCKKVLGEGFLRKFRGGREGTETKTKTNADLNIGSSFDIAKEVAANMNADMTLLYESHCRWAAVVGERTFKAPQCTLGRVGSTATSVGRGLVAS